MGIASIAPDINTAAAQFVTKRGKLLINNQWTDAASGKTFPTYDPATGEVLAQIDAALKRIDEGTYGTCVSCGGEIAPARLEAYAWASLCIDCKRRAEA